jgi:hypothetical protein
MKAISLAVLVHGPVMKAISLAVLVYGPVMNQYKSRTQI